jgi:hypothetical protein
MPVDFAKIHVSNLALSARCASSRTGCPLFRLAASRTSRSGSRLLGLTNQQKRDAP